MRKWEYLVVGPIKDIFQGSWPISTMLTIEGQKVEKIGDISPKISKEQDKLGALVAQKGLDGWEMIGTGATNVGHILYFKREVRE